MGMDGQASLHGYLSYRDAPRALTWMAQIGFEIVARQDDPTVGSRTPRSGTATPS